MVTGDPATIWALIEDYGRALVAYELDRAGDPLHNDPAFSAKVLEQARAKLRDALGLPAN